MIVSLYLGNVSKVSFPAFALRGLAEDPDMHYFTPIEFGPDDLASPRATRRTDDLLPKSRSYGLAALPRGLLKHIPERSVS
jgi:hypothetical protein